MSCFVLAYLGSPSNLFLFTHRLNCYTIHTGLNWSRHLTLHSPLVHSFCQALFISTFTDVACEIFLTLLVGFHVIFIILFENFPIGVLTISTGTNMLLLSSPE